MPTQLHNQNKPFAGATLRKESVDKPLVNGSFIMENKEEIWKDVVGFEGKYQASTLGNIRSLDRMCWGGKVYYFKKGKNLAPINNGSGYLCVTLSPKCRKYIHQIIAKTFIPNPLNLNEVNHKDFNRTNNSVSNLEWVTRLQNVKHMIANNRKGTYDKSGKNNPRYKHGLRVRICEERICLLCGNKFIAKWIQSTMCSAKCRCNFYMNGGYKPKL